MSGRRIFWSGLFLAVLPAIAGLGLDLPAMVPPGPLKFAAVSFIVHLPILVLLGASALYDWQAGRRHPRAWVRIASRVHFVVVVVAFAFGAFALGVGYTQAAEGKSFTSAVIAAGFWLAPVGLALAVQVVDWIIQGRVPAQK